MPSISLKLPDQLVEKIDALAKGHGQPRATYMRSLVEQGVALDCPFPTYSLVQFKSVEDCPTLWRAAAANFQGQSFQVHGVALCPDGPMVLLQQHPCAEPFAPHLPVHRDALRLSADSPDTADAAR